MTLLNNFCVFSIFLCRYVIFGTVNLFKDKQADKRRKMKIKIDAKWGSIWKLWVFVKLWVLTEHPGRFCFIFMRF